MVKRKLLIFAVLVIFTSMFTFGLNAQAIRIAGNFEFLDDEYHLTGESENTISFATDDDEILTAYLNYDDEVLETIVVKYDDVVLEMTDADDPQNAEITYDENNTSVLIYETSMTEITSHYEEVYLLFRVKHIINIMNKPTFFRTVTTTLSFWALLVLLIFPQVFRFKKFQIKGKGIIFARIFSGIGILLNLVGYYIYLLF